MGMPSPVLNIRDRVFVADVVTFIITIASRWPSFNQGMEMAIVPRWVIVPLARAIGAPIPYASFISVLPLQWTF
ncbi:hypothetical protein C1J05_20095 [Sulfitobacter sp. JL08]|nr:hypothetical protein C1J05_20095 [Sulfitobacter sp. JL08]